MPWINPRLRRGEERRVVTGIPGKTGLVYTLDRATGEFLWARPTITQNVIERIDGATGAVEVRADALFTGPDQEPPHLPDDERRQELARGRVQPAHEDDVLRDGEHVRMDDLGRGGTATPEMLYAINTDNVIAPDADGNAGTLRAISVETGKAAWRYDQRAALMALLATGGDLVFGGDVAGALRAFDAETGKVLWETSLGAPSHGPPRDVRRGRQTVRGRQHGPLEHDGRADAAHARRRTAPTARTSCSCSRCRTSGKAARLPTLPYPKVQLPPRRRHDDSVGRRIAMPVIRCPWIFRATAPLGAAIALLAANSAWSQQPPAQPATPPAPTQTAAQALANRQPPTPAKSGTFLPEELEQMVAPIALYPDPLIAQVLMSSTYPLEIVEAARWRKANPSVTGDAVEEALKRLGLGSKREIDRDVPRRPRHDGREARLDPEARRRLPRATG